MEFQPGTKTRSGYLAVPASGQGPGILVLHAWWGLNEFFVELCERLAREGFVALAPDCYEGEVARSVEEAKQVQRQYEGKDPEAVEKKVFQALNALQQHPAVQGQKVGVLGCSMGVWWGVQLATQRPDDVAAAVLFYGAAEGDFAASRCAYQAHFAENDEWEPLEQARKMEAAIRAAGREVEFYVYPGVGHWFFEANQPEAYDAESARLAWDRTVSFLRDQLPQG